MASHAKAAQHLARTLFKLSVVDGEVSAERVAGVLAYIEKDGVAHPLAVLRAYHRLVAAEVAKGVAVVEHAGAVSPGALSAIAEAMAARYRRAVRATSSPNPALIAGMRVRVGDDIYEASVAAQLAALGAAV